MSSGRRYNDERKLNMKKVVGVIVALIVLVMIIVSMKMLLDPKKEKPITSQAYYFSAYHDGKWGVINSTGSEVIPFEYEEMIIVPDNQKDIFVAMTDVDLVAGTFKTKVLNKKSEELFKEYDLVEAIDNFDAVGNIWYEKNVLRVKKDGKYGLINFNGAKILEAKYDNIYSLKGTKNSLIIVDGENIGLASNVGDVIVPVEYKKITAAGSDYSNGYIVQNSDGIYGLIGEDKKIILEPKYTEIKQVSGNGMHVVRDDETLKIVNEEGATVLDSNFTDVLQISGDNLVLKRDERVGVLTTSGVEKIPFEYQELKDIGNNHFIAKKDDKYGVIDGEGKTVLDFKFSYIKQRKDTDFIEADTDSTQTEIYNKDMELKLTGIVSNVNVDKGFIQIRIGQEQKYYNFKFEEKNAVDFYPNHTLFLSKKDGKYGYTNAKGELVVEYIYDDAKEQNEYGYCSVKKGSVWGSLNSVGNVALKPSVNLDSNLLVDFIGIWHLAEDLNMYYYEQ